MRNDDYERKQLRRTNEAGEEFCVHRNRFSLSSVFAKADVGKGRGCTTRIGLCEPGLQLLSTIHHRLDGFQEDLANDVSET